MVKDLGWFGNEMPSKEGEREKRKEKETDKENKGYLKGDENRKYEHRLKERGWGDERGLIGDKIRERNSLRKERLTAHHSTREKMEANADTGERWHSEGERSENRYEKGYRGTR